MAASCRDQNLKPDNDAPNVGFQMNTNTEAGSRVSFILLIKILSHLISLSSSHTCVYNTLYLHLILPISALLLIYPLSYLKLVSPPLSPNIR